VDLEKEIEHGRSKTEYSLISTPVLRDQWKNDWIKEPPIYGTKLSSTEKEGGGGSPWAAESRQFSLAIHSPALLRRATSGPLHSKSEKRRNGILIGKAGESDQTHKVNAQPVTAGL